ncbi:hypothetical protein BN2127_JRS9_01130 [Bacillus subtilis]|nr:hypothetical protein BSP4_28780 [Bacillus subtilis subsp. subtilis]QHL54838.1 hypothetical protein C7M23_01961 [Bacillus subtilis]TQJ98867.1 hypothetical protein FB592_3028 [Bacillus sp. SJZ110]QHM03900.1 hypothetical protein C7M26_04136 [Bacillus subtilis]QHM04813.1 hypothetical protein C7M27_00748 [Bacillus subtilis]
MVLSWEACSQGFPLFEPVSFLRVLINTCVFLNLLCIINCSIQKINTIAFPFFKPTALYRQAAGPHPSECFTGISASVKACSGSISTLS